MDAWAEDTAAYVMRTLAQHMEVELSSRRIPSVEPLYKHITPYTLNPKLQHARTSYLRP